MATAKKAAAKVAVARKAAPAKRTAAKKALPAKRAAAKKAPYAVKNRGDTSCYDGVSGIKPVKTAKKVKKG